jgi:DNA repair exonuclease SbcCD nuclease subunit
MKIIASGDHHFDEHRRLAECIRIHAWIADLVREERPDVFLSGGDIYERASTPTEREAVAEWLSAVAEVCPVVIAKGNHERPLDVFWLRRLRTRHPIIVEERAAVHVVAGAAIATVAWPSRSALATMAGGEAAGTDAAAKDALAAILRGLGGELAAHNGPRVLLGHFMIDGSRTSTGQELLGAEMNVSLADLALAGADVVIASHIHLAQGWEIGGAPVLMCGSPFRQNFGEMEPKSVVLLEWTGGRLARVERVPTPATPMVHLEEEWDAEAGRFPWIEEADFPPGAELRLRYRVAATHRDAARRSAQEWAERFRAAGAVSVKVEECVEASTRSRTPEVARATTLREKMRALWEARKDVPDPVREDALVRKLSELEGAA